jgi:hypothetical protein
MAKNTDPCGNCLDWGHNKRSCRSQPVSNGRRERARDWLAEGANRELEVNSDREDQETEIEDEEIEQEEEDQAVKEEDSELSDVGSDQFKDSDMIYSVIEALESNVIPEVMLEVMPRVASRRATRSGRVLG